MEAKVITRSRQRRLTRSVKVSRDKRFPLLLQELAGDESCGSAHHVTRLRWITHTHTQDVEAQCLERTPTWRGSRADLPPVGIFSVDDLEDVAPLENHPGLPARDQVVAGGVVVKVRPHVHLRERERGRDATVSTGRRWELPLLVVVVVLLEQQGSRSTVDTVSPPESQRKLKPSCESRLFRLFWLQSEPRRSAGTPPGGALCIYVFSLIWTDSRFTDSLALRLFDLVTL